MYHCAVSSLSAGVDPTISQHVCLKETTCSGYLVKLGGELLLGKGEVGISAGGDQVMACVSPSVTAELRSVIHMYATMHAVYKSRM